MKRILSMLLVFVMLFSMVSLTACGGGGISGGSGGGDTAANDNTDTKASGDDNTPADTEKPADTEAPAGPEVDETGYELVPDAVYKGRVGVGTWATSAQYDDLKVTNNKGNAVLYENDFSDAATLSDFSYFTTNGGNWDAASGAWTVTTADDNGVLEMPDAAAEGTTAVVGNPNWANYTVSVKGKVTGGKEGLELFFNVVDENNYYFFALGGWNNTCFCVQKVENGVKSIVTDQIPITLTPDKWYTIKVRVNTNGVMYGYIDDERLFAIGVENDSSDTFSGTIGLSTWATSARYKNIMVTSLSDGAVLLAQPFTSDAASVKDGWSAVTLNGGGWAATLDEWEPSTDGIESTNVSATGVGLVYDAGTSWSNYKISLDAYKTGGAEVFIILLAYKEVENYTHWNIGGWSNTKTCYEYIVNGAKSQGNQIDHKLNADQWYHIECVVTDYAIFSYLDGEFYQAAWK